MRLLRIAARERAELRRRHAQRPRSPQRVLDRHLRLAPQRTRVGVQGRGTFDGIDRAQLQMILQVLADARQRVLDLDAQRVEYRSRPEA